MRSVADTLMYERERVRMVKELHLHRLRNAVPTRIVVASGGTFTQEWPREHTDATARCDRIFAAWAHVCQFFANHEDGALSLALEELGREIDEFVMWSAGAKESP